MKFEICGAGGHMLMVTHPREVCETLAAKMRKALKGKSRDAPTD
jgi:hypothetical protein